jgi:hypothetical protein
MLVAHEMKVVSPAPDAGGSHDRVGGLPTYRPPVFPVSEAFGGQHCFLLQLHGLDRVGLASFRCLQIYQSAYVDEGDDPLPVAILVPLDAPLNDAGEGRVKELGVDEVFCVFLEVAFAALDDLTA